MSIKNILLAYTGSKSSDSALAAALVLRGQFDAHLTALFAYIPSYVSGTLKPWMPQNVFDTVNQLEDAQLQDIESGFFSLVKDHAPPDKLHWIAQIGEAGEIVSDHARLYDLTLIGRDNDTEAPTGSQLDAERIALAGGRPVLVIPQSFSLKKFSEQALIAWDGKRAAARALADALPILETRQQVTILSIDSGEPADTSGKITLDTALRRHGIYSKPVRLERRGRDSIEKILLDYLQQDPPGLLVMGASEQRGGRNQHFGRLTDSILRNTAIPLLVSF
ncbi:MAG: universal stress protein [Gammaproteobacteria bacterium]|nr:universal stress protein [Gammaproteobacteria bacterium]